LTPYLLKFFKQSRRHIAESTLGAELFVHDAYDLAFDVGREKCGMELKGGSNWIGF
jgi:hypothetical protein